MVCWELEGWGEGGHGTVNNQYSRNNTDKGKGSRPHRRGASTETSVKCNVHPRIYRYFIFPSASEVQSKLCVGNIMEKKVFSSHVKWEWKPKNKKKQNKNKQLVPIRFVHVWLQVWKGETKKERPVVSAPLWPQGRSAARTPSTRPGMFLRVGDVFFVCLVCSYCRFPSRSSRLVYTRCARLWWVYCPIHSFLYSYIYIFFLYNFCQTHTYNIHLAVIDTFSISVSSHHSLPLIHHTL